MGWNREERQHSGIFLLRELTAEFAGDVLMGHRHSFGHMTICGTGGVLARIFKLKDGVTDEQLERIGYKPELLDFIREETILAVDMQTEKVKRTSLTWIERDEIHEFTALRDNTNLICVHVDRDEETLEPVKDYAGNKMSAGNALRDKFIKEGKQWPPVRVLEEEVIANEGVFGIGVR